MHGLIVGQTMSGKTTLARQIARQHQAAGRGVLVCDPLFDEELRSIADWSTDDPMKFLEVAWKNENCTLVIDEGGEAIGRYSVLLEKLGTQARHLGHMSIFISQRPVQLPLTLRDQCAWLAAFAIRARDAERLAEDYNNDLILSASGFEKGQYLIHRPFEPTTTGHIFGGTAPMLRGQNEIISSIPAGTSQTAKRMGIDSKSTRRRLPAKKRPNRKP